MNLKKVIKGLMFCCLSFFFIARARATPRPLLPTSREVIMEGVIMDQPSNSEVYKGGSQVDCLSNPGNPGESSYEMTRGELQVQASRDVIAHTPITSQPSVIKPVPRRPPPRFRTESAHRALTDQPSQTEVDNVAGSSQVDCVSNPGNPGETLGEVEAPRDVSAPTALMSHHSAFTPVPRRLPPISRAVSAHTPITNQPSIFTSVGVSRELSELIARMYQSLPGNLGETLGEVGAPRDVSAPTALTSQPSVFKPTVGRIIPPRGMNADNAAITRQLAALTPQCQFSLFVTIFKATAVHRAITNQPPQTGVSNVPANLLDLVNILNKRRSIFDRTPVEAEAFRTSIATAITLQRPPSALSNFMVYERTISKIEASRDVSATARTTYQPSDFSAFKPYKGKAQVENPGNPGKTLGEVEAPREVIAPTAITTYQPPQTGVDKVPSRLQLDLLKNKSFDKLTVSELKDLSYSVTAENTHNPRKSFDEMSISELKELSRSSVKNKLGEFENELCHVLSTKSHITKELSELEDKIRDAASNTPTSSQVEHLIEALLGPKMSQMTHVRIAKRTKYQMDLAKASEKRKAKGNAFESCKKTKPNSDSSPK